MNPPSPTIVSVAKLAGVSVSTVSHVLNGTRPVQPATRQRVLDAIAQTSYKQDALARSLRRSRTDSIGLIVSDAGEPAFAEMMHGVEWAGADLGLTLLLANSAENPDREMRAVEALLARRVDGLILARAAGSPAEVINVVSRDKAKLVLLDRIFELPYDQVGAENEEPMRELVAHLAATGHKRIALVAGDTRVPTLAERVRGFHTAVEKSQLDPVEQVLIADEPQISRVSSRVVESLMSARRPTAYVACSTVLAAATLTVFRGMGIWTPSDVAFATFDGFSHRDLFEPGLTTVRQPAFEVGAMAVRLLSERLQGSSAAPRTLRLPQVIEYRASTTDFALT